MFIVYLCCQQIIKTQGCLFSLKIVSHHMPRKKILEVGTECKKIVWFFFAELGKINVFLRENVGKMF